MFQRREFALCIVFVFIFINSAASKLVYFSSPTFKDSEDILIHKSGIYGANLNEMENYTLENEHQYGFNCLSSISKSYEAVKSRSISYDPISKRILTQLETELPSTTTIIWSHICRDLIDCESEDDEDETDINPMYIDASLLANSNIGPCAYYDSTMYCLVTNHRTKLIQLFRFDKYDCPLDVPVTSSFPYDFEKCTTLIGSIEEFPSDEEKTHYENLITDHLIPVTTEFGLQFFTMILTVGNIEKHIKSYNISLVVFNRRGNAEILESIELPIELSSYKLHHVGGISFMESKLCWSSLIQISCGIWNGKTILNKEIVLPIGASSKLCKDIETDLILKNVTTGVAILQSNPPFDVELLFGCVLNGGSGILKKQGETTELHGIKGAKGKVQMGQILITDECNRPKKENPSKELGPPYETYTQGTSPTDESSAVLTVNCMFMILILNSIALLFSF